MLALSPFVIAAAGMTAAMSQIALRSSIPAVAGEYLQQPLAGQVSALKASARGSSTNESNAAARARTLYDWANAFALAGREINPDLPILVTNIVDADVRDWNIGDSAKERMFSQLDMLIDEMTFRDANPKALGVLMPVEDAPIQANAYGTWSQAYVVGEAPVRPGGGFMITVRITGAVTTVQTSDPTADNYLSVRSSRDDVRFEATRHPFSGLFAGTFGSGQDTPQAFIKVASGVLQPGDRVTFTMGDTSGGSKGYRAPSFSTDGVRLRVWVKLGEGARIFPLKEVPFRAVGASPAGVRGLGP